MLLSDSFWHRSGGDKTAIISDDELKTTQYNDELLEVKAFPHPLTSPSGEQGRIQRKLWEVFGIDMEPVWDGVAFPEIEP